LRSDDLDPVGKPYTEDDFRELIMAIKALAICAPSNVARGSGPHLLDRLQNPSALSAAATQDPS
jgi:hypothetical protein